MKYSKFFIVFLIVLYKAIMYYPFINNYILYSLIILICLLTFFEIYFKKFQKNFFVKFVILLFFCLLSILNTASVNFLFPILLIMLYDKKEYKILSKYFFLSLIFCFIMTIFLNLIGILPSYNGIRFGEVRYSLGFQYPGFVGLYFFAICLSAYIAFDNEKRNMLIALPFSILFYKLSLSRAGLLGYICLVISSFLPKKVFLSSKLKQIIKAMFPICTIIVIIVVNLYVKYGWNELNDLFSGRLIHYYQYIKQGLLTKPFGSQPIPGYTIDNYFLYFFYDYGFVGYFIYLLLNHLSIRKIDDYKLLLVLLSIYIYGLFDSNIVVTSINPVITIQLLYIISKKNEEVL